MSVWKTLSRVLRIGHARFEVGKDLANNTYYEFPSPHGSTDPRHTRRVIKYAVKRHQSEYNPKDLPIQWDAWMRHTRRKPPTIDELLQDLERQRIVQHNARVLEMREQAAQAQLEAVRQEEHAQALAEQHAREQRRRAQSLTAEDPELAAQRAEAEKSDIQSTTVRPARRGG